MIKDIESKTYCINKSYLKHSLQINFKRVKEFIINNKINSEK